MRSRPIPDLGDLEMSDHLESMDFYIIPLKSMIRGVRSRGLVPQNDRFWTGFDTPFGGVGQDRDKWWGFLMESGFTVA